MVSRMSVRHISLILTLVCPVLLGPGSAVGADKIPISQKNAKCILENKTKYLSHDRALIALVPEACPHVGAEAVRRLAEASDVMVSEQTEMIIGTKKNVYWLKPLQVTCLVENIESYFSEQQQDSGTDTTPDEIISFILDCKA